MKLFELFAESSTDTNAPINVIADLQYNHSHIDIFYISGNHIGYMICQVRLCMIHVDMNKRVLGNTFRRHLLNEMSSHIH